MALLYKNSESCLIDHREFITNTYKDVTIGETETRSFSILAKLFSIFNIERLNRKRTHDADDMLEETVTVKEIYERFLQEVPLDIKDNLLKKYKLLNVTTVVVREFSKGMFESTFFDLRGLSGGNNSNTALQCKVKRDLFLIPSHSRFYCGCVKKECLKLEGSKFDIVVADPPWWNKYIRRLRRANERLSYSMMYNKDIAAIPVEKFLSNNCLVAVWCTNAPSNVDAVKNLIFPKWGVEYVATWFWLKVTVDLQPICSFGSGFKKQPYERIILGKVGDVEDIPDCQLVISVPSALHSHKPPLIELLSPFVKTENPQTLELFARYLLPNTTSIGYETLKWQHKSLFEEVT